MDKEGLILELYDIGAIKFGDFKLKNGLASPIYLDLRLIISYPKLLKQLGGLMFNLIHSKQFDLVCGIPYAALPIATCLSLEHHYPMVIRRREIKDYGTRKIVEGVYKPHQTCLVIEDVMTTGASILETVEALEGEQLTIKDIAVVVDRQQGGHIRLMQKGYHLHTLFTITEILEVLNEYQKITSQDLNRVQSHLKENIK